MRIVSIITAILVAAVLYGVVLKRDALLSWTARLSPSAEERAEAATDPAPAPEAAPVESAMEARDTPENAVRVMANRSVAQEIDSAVQLRGETQALRQVEVRAETAGKVISTPLRKGALVEEGQLLCELDPGTREVTLMEARARLAEAKAMVPEARARLAEAEAQIPAARARITEAEAAVPAAEAALEEAESRVPEAEARVRQAEAQVREAEINLTAASSLAKDGFAAQTRLASAEAAYETAKASVQTAQAGLKAAASGIQAARSGLEGAHAGVETARSNIEAARAAVQAARSGIRNAEAGVIAARTQIENAKAGVQTAQSLVEGARARVSTALSNVEGAKAAVISANSQLEGAQAGIQSARTGEESALSAIQSAEAAVAAAQKDIDRLSITAPFAGLLETDTAELGALMQPGSACATVIQLDPVKIVAYVPETSVSRIDLGAQAGARLADGREVAGIVAFVSRSADPATRTFRVELEVANPDLTIRDGQTADILIEAEGAKGHLVAQSTLTLDDEGALGVRTVTEEETAKFIPVTILRDTRDGVWVTGLPDTVDVIVLGQEYVTDGVPVVPSFEEVIQ